MSLEDLGNVGEFLAAIGVIVSLIYLALQIRQNTESVRASTQLASRHAISEFNRFLAHGTPPTAAMLASELPTRPGQVQVRAGLTPGVNQWFPEESPGDLPRVELGRGNDPVIERLNGVESERT